MKNSVIILFSLIIILVFYSLSFAVEDMCFDKDTSSKMVVELEKGRLNENILKLQDESIKLLEMQKQQLLEINKLKDEQINVLKETNERYKDLLKTQSEVYEKIIKENKPSIIQDFIKSLGFVGVGILLGGLIL